MTELLFMQMFDIKLQLNHIFINNISVFKFTYIPQKTCINKLQELLYDFHNFSEIYYSMHLPLSFKRNQSQDFCKSQLLFHLNSSLSENSSQQTPTMRYFPCIFLAFKHSMKHPTRYVLWKRDSWAYDKMVLYLF